MHQKYSKNTKTRYLTNILLKHTKNVIKMYEIMCIVKIKSFSYTNIKTVKMPFYTLLHFLKYCYYKNSYYKLRNIRHLYQQYTILRI